MGVTFVQKQFIIKVELKYVTSMLGFEMSGSRDKVIQYLKDHGVTSKSELYSSCCGNYYYNGSKHFGEILSRMVISGVIERPKHGYYSLPSQKTEFAEGDLFGG